MRIIYADEFAEAIENLDWYSLLNGKMIQGAEGSDNAYYKASDIYTEINKAMTIRADVIEPKHGRWIPLRKEGCYKCSECLAASRVDNAGIPRLYWNYCPNCGAKMDKE